MDPNLPESSLSSGWISRRISNHKSEAGLVLPLSIKDKENKEMIDNTTYIPGASNDFFSIEAYKARMAAYTNGIRKYRLKEAAQVESKKKADRIGGAAL